MRPVRKAIIPVAGYGTRFLPVTKAMPKEMLPVVDKPVIQYLVEEAVASGITDIIFVTGRGKRAIEDHFDASYELERTLVERDKRDLLKLVEHLPKLARFVYVRQPMPRGNGDAILRAAHLIGPDEPFAVLFGDDLIDAPRPALAQVIAVFQKRGAPTMALARVPRADLSRYGTIAGSRKEGRAWNVERIIEKPKNTAAIREPLAVVGRYVLTPGVLVALYMAERTLGKDRELGITDGLARYVRDQPVCGVELAGAWYDCGSKIGYLAANIAFAKKRPELRTALNRMLKH